MGLRRRIAEAATAPSARKALAPLRSPTRPDRARDGNGAAARQSGVLEGKALDEESPVCEGVELDLARCRCGQGVRAHDMQELFHVNPFVGLGHVGRSAAIDVRRHAVLAPMLAISCPVRLTAQTGSVQPRSRTACFQDADHLMVGCADRRFA